MVEEACGMWNGKERRVGGSSVPLMDRVAGLHAHGHGKRERGALGWDWLGRAVCNDALLRHTFWDAS